MDYLSAIVERKRREVTRRKRFATAVQRMSRPVPCRDGAAALRRKDGDPLRVLAEVKFRSPSAGVIRFREAGELVRIAKSYSRGGAAAVSVLADGEGFGGSVLDVRRGACAVELPILFKEFVVDPIQIDFANAAGASMVLLLANVLTGDSLGALCDATLRRGLHPVLEVADDEELRRALDTEGVIIGVNARDLRTFRVDPARAQDLIEKIPGDRVAVYMSGISTDEDFARVAAGRADAVLMGEALMRAADPAAVLARNLRRR